MERITSHQVVGLMEAYGAVHAPQITEEQIWEEVEIWTNSLLEEGYDLSEYTWDELYEHYITEVVMTGQNRPTKPLSNPINSIGAGLKTGIGNLQKAVTPAAQAVRGTLNRANTAATSAVTGAGAGLKTGIGNVQKASTPYVQAARGALNRANTAATSAVTGAGAAVAGAANAAGRKIGQEVEISRRVGAGQPANAPTVAKSPVGPASPSSQYTKQNLGGAQYAAFKGGGGDAAIRQGRSAGEVVAQGRKNISKVVSGREMNVTAPGVVKSSFDIFDVIKGHLIDEGYADTEDAALQIMANMSEEWRENIIGEANKHERHLLKDLPKNLHRTVKSAMRSNSNQNEPLTGRQKRIATKSGNIKSANYDPDKGISPSGSRRGSESSTEY
jgi:hypothetical protein